MFARQRGEVNGVASTGYGGCRWWAFILKLYKGCSVASSFILAGPKADHAFKRSASRSREAGFWR